MIYIISSKYVTTTGKISYSYMFDAGCDKCACIPYGYLWESEDRYVLNLFENGLILAIGGPVSEFKTLLGEIPECSILMTDENAEVFTGLLKGAGIEYEWIQCSKELRTSQ